MLTFRLQKLTVSDIQVSTSSNTLLQKKQVKLVLNVLLLSIFMMVCTHAHLITHTYKHMHLRIFVYINLSTYKNLAYIVFTASTIVN